MTGDDLWLAEKFQSNSEIAGSPRNSFRASVVRLAKANEQITGGKALNELGAERLLNSIKLRMPENRCTAVRQWEISFIVERETAQIHS